MAPPYTEQQKALLRELLDAGTILIGDVVRARFGMKSPIYIDLREKLYAQPGLLMDVGREFAEKIRELTLGNPVPQCVVGIPDTATPLALATALYAWQQRTQPEIVFAMLRKEGKTYPGLPTRYWIGTKDPNWEYNLIDDVVASGLSKRTSAAKTNLEGIALRRIIVLFDRQQGDGLSRDGFELHGIFKVPEVMDFYLSEDRIRPEEHETIIRFLQSRRFDSSPIVK